MSENQFEWYDYVIFVVTLLISLGIGVFYACSGGKQKTTKEYLMGNRNLGVLPVGLSMFMSYVSAILVLGNTAEMYTRGPQQWLAWFGSSLAFISTCFIFVPLFFPLKLTSSFEYLEKRFNSKAVKLTGTLLLMLSQILYMGIAMFSPATALDAVTGIPTWASIIATGVVATIYTTMGGMKAVVWTDVFQSVIMLGGLIAILAVGTHKSGGIAEVWRICGDWGRLDLFDFDPSPTIRLSFWSVVLGRFVSSTQTVGTGQTSVQRYCALPTKQKAQLSVFFNIPCLLLMYTLTSLCGFAMFAYYTKLGCDPLRSGQVDNQNQLLPYFIVNALETPALPGLFVAVLFSGSLSTLSSSLNSLSAVTWKDMLEWKYHYISEERKALVTKCLAAVFGCIAIGMAFGAEILGDHVLQASQSFVSGVAGPLLGVFILGGFFPCANWIGAVVGAWVGLAMAMVCTVGAYVTTPHRAYMNTSVENCSYMGFNETKDIPVDPEGVFPLFRMSFMWFAGLGTVTCIVVGFFVSLITGPTKPSEVDPDLVIPVFDRILCCLPASIRRFLWCGVHHELSERDDDGYIIKHDGETKGENNMYFNEKPSFRNPIGYIDGAGTYGSYGSKVTELTSPDDLTERKHANGNLFKEDPPPYTGQLNTGFTQEVWDDDTESVKL